MRNCGSETFDKAGKEYVRKYEGVLLRVGIIFKGSVATMIETVNSDFKTEKLN
jgi:hypothetical protein